MLKKKYIIFIAIIMLSMANSGSAADFFPETGLNPFNSELNPEFLNPEEFATGEFEIKKFFKNKIKNKKAQKQQTEQTDKNNAESDKKETINKQTEKKEQNKLKTESFISKPKKPLTKAQLERELNKEEREKQNQINKELRKEDNRTLLEKIFNLKNEEPKNVKKKGKDKYTPPENPNIDISANYMEYFPDTYEIQALGNAKVVFQAQAAKVEADKIVYDYDKNILKASDNVILTTSDSVTEGDFLKLDLSKPNGWIENPSTITDDIKITAKEAFVYSDNITEYDGVAKILKDDVLNLGGRSFSSYVDQSGLFDENYKKISEENKGIYKLRANTIIIDSKDDHEIITVKNAGVYLKNRKLAVIPTLKIVSNKAHTNVETNIPEFGSQSMLGMHFGPAIVLNVPGGSTLKLAPIITYGNSDWGLGGIARFRSETNVTQVAYGTSKENVVVRGKQKLAPGFLFNYSRYSNQSEWFLGYRMPKYSANFSYNRSDYISDLDLTFSQMYSAGLYVDNNPDYDLSNTHSRFRWMTQTYKPLYKYQNKEGNVGLLLGVIAQTSATVYSQGNTVGLFRIGPSLNTQVGRWKQALMYYQTASAGDSPFEFDRYRYGKSNIALIESIKVCKYLTLGYLASISMHNPYHDDYHNDDLFQENRIMVSIGPEYAKLTIGYDSIRHTTMMLLSMLVGTKDSDIEFKKTILKNPDKFGREKNKQKKVKKKSYKKYKKELLRETEQK